MKIGIITFNRAVNYGAVLQSYALKKNMCNFGHNCEVINYKCDEIEKEASPFYIKSFKLKDFIIFVLQIRMRIKKNKKFKVFTNKYLDTANSLVTSENITKIKDKYDLVITGSDQVWNYEITGLDSNYFLDFVGDNTLTVSYAASFGVESIPTNLKANYVKLLRNIDCISVREEAGKEIVKDFTGKDVPVVSDPVFLISKDEWIQLAVKPLINEKYILVYSINKTACYQMAEKISKDTGFKIVGLQTPLSNKTNCKKVRDESPEEFLGWFNNAEYVITDSFHGTAFSIIFNKQFILCDGGEGTNRLSRHKTLLKTMGLGNRKGSLENYRIIYESIDFQMVNNNINIAKNNSKRFLESVCNK